MIVDEHTYLLVDDELIASETNTSMVRGEAFKHAANPIVDESCKALFGNKRGYRIWVRCICRDGGRYRMWYTYDLDERGPRRDAYAESDDGLAWKPVRVGRSGNHTPGPDRDDLQFGDIMHDVRDRDFPYKMVVTRHGDLSKMNPAFMAKYPAANKQWGPHPSSGWFVWGLAKSRDGFDWQLPTHEDNMVDAIIEGPAVHRALDGGYVIGNQMISCVGDIQWRKVKGWVTYDLATSHRIPDWVFALPDHIMFVDPRYTGRQAWANTPWIQSHVQLVPAAKGPTMLALHGYLYGATGCETYAQVADVGLAISSTGYHFHQVWPFRPFLRRGNMGEWDCGLVAQQALVDTPTETRLYYLASDAGNAAGCAYRLGCGVIGRDRYGYRAIRVFRDYKEAKARRGEVTLKPITLPDRPRLAVNVSHVTRGRTVRVALRDAKTGRVLPGLTFAKCRPIAREALRAKVAWEGRDVSKLAGRSVSVSIEITSRDCQFGDQHSPRVYAFYAS